MESGLDCQSATGGGGSGGSAKGGTAGCVGTIGSGRDCSGCSSRARSSVFPSAAFANLFAILV